jgi:hypothetical protein
MVRRLAAFAVALRESEAHLRVPAWLLALARGFSSRGPPALSV